MSKDEKPMSKEVAEGMILLMKERLELLECLVEMVNQHCSIDGKLDSCAMGTNMDAIRLLAKHGKIKITSEYGRTVRGEWVKS